MSAFQRPGARAFPLVASQLVMSLLPHQSNTGGCIYPLALNDTAPVSQVSGSGGGKVSEMLDPLADTISKCFQSLEHSIAVTHKMRD